jgi:two-component system sensor histidine kinase BaeS
MKILIKYRIFMALLLATGAVVLFMFLIVNWSIKRGFFQYVLTMEEQRLERLAGDLGTAFALEGSWSFLHHNTKRWAQILVKTLPADRVTPDRQERVEKMLSEYVAPFQGAATSARRGAQFEARVILLDADRHPVNGPDVPGTAAVTRDIISRGAVVGYVVLLPKKRLTDTLHLRFVEQQKLALSLISVVMLLISGAMSYYLATHLVKPIRTMTTAIHRLASGAFNTRVTTHSSDELGQLARDINSLAYTLEKNEQLRRQWVADISHELRTPLAVLRGEIEAIQDGVRQANPEAISSLHGEVVRLNRLVEDLYQLSLADSGVLTCRNENLNVGVALSRAVTLFKPCFVARDIKVSLAVPREDIFLYADPERMHQLFTNLLDNSLKYTDSGGRLETGMAVRDGKVVLSFQDTAPSVPEEELPRLFDRLYRVESSRSRTSGGAGLGLAICRNIVDALEGTIVALPSALGGVLIVVELPLTEIRS